jgi:hypothetical protein
MNVQGLLRGDPGCVGKFVLPRRACLLLTFLSQLKMDHSL